MHIFLSAYWRSCVFFNHHQIFLEKNLLKPLRSCKYWNLFERCYQIHNSFTPPNQNRYRKYYCLKKMCTQRIVLADMKRNNAQKFCLLAASIAGSLFNNGGISFGFWCFYESQCNVHPILFLASPNFRKFYPCMTWV